MNNDHQDIDPVTKNEGANSRRPKIIKLIWWIPHYRVPIFRRLSQNPNWDFTICAGDNTRIFGGETIASAKDVGNIDGVNWKYVESWKIKGPLFRDYEWQPETIKYVWREKPDVLISFGNKSISNWFVRIVCKLRNIPIVEWSQGVLEPERGLKWALRKFYLKWAKAHLLYGNWARNFFAQNGFSENELFVVFNSLDHDEHVAIRNAITQEKIRETRSRLSVTNEERLLFHIGRLETKKNLPILLDALGILKQRGKRIKLVLIGEGREEHNLKEQVRRLNIEDIVQFYGPSYDETELGYIISASDLCVVPGVCGLIAMHSLVYGTPILTGDNTKLIQSPEVESVIEGQTGAFFHDYDENDLVDKIEMMLYPISAKERMRVACMNVIDTCYTPEYQERVVIQAVNHVLPGHMRIPLPKTTNDKT